MMQIFDEYGQPILDEIGVAIEDERGSAAAADPAPVWDGVGYKTVQGDMWDVIAKKLYGTEMMAGALIGANPAYRDVVFFSAGVVLDVPEMADDSILEGLPPWKN